MRILPCFRLPEFPAASQVLLSFPAVSVKGDEDGKQGQQQHHNQHSFRSMAQARSRTVPPFAQAPFGSTRSMAFWSKSLPNPQEPAPMEQDNGFSDSSPELLQQFGQGVGAGGLGGSEEMQQPEHLPMPVGSEDAVLAVHDACNAVEATALLAAKEESFFAASWFIDAIIWLHAQAGLPWCVFRECCTCCTSTC